MIYTTLNKIRDKRPCAEGWAKLLKSLDKKEADDEPLSLETILHSNGIEDALWATRTLPEHSKKWRLFAVWCARQVQHLMTDERSIAALDIAEAYANELVSDAELAAAREAAMAAAWAATEAGARAAARAGAWEAAGVATGASAGEAAGAATGAAAWEAARAAAGAAAGAAARAGAGAAARAGARAGAMAAAWEAAGAAAGAAQKIEFLRIVSEG